jgi:hypothetical protein
MVSLVAVFFAILRAQVASAREGARSQPGHEEANDDAEEDTITTTNRRTKTKLMAACARGECGSCYCIYYISYQLTDVKTVIGEEERALWDLAFAHLFGDPPPSPSSPLTHPPPPPLPSVVSPFLAFCCALRAVTGESQSYPWRVRAVQGHTRNQESDKTDRGVTLSLSEHGLPTPAPALFPGHR